MVAITMGPPATGRRKPSRAAASRSLWIVSAGRSFGSCAMNFSTDICMETGGSWSPTWVRLVATLIGWLLQHAAVQPIPFAGGRARNVVEHVRPPSPEDLEPVLVHAGRFDDEVLALAFHVLVDEAPRHDHPLVQPDRVQVLALEADEEPSNIVPAGEEEPDRSIAAQDWRDPAPEG